MVETQPPQSLATQRENVSRHLFDLLSVFHAESQTTPDRIAAIRHLAELDLNIPEQHPDLPPVA